MSYTRPDSHLAVLPSPTPLPTPTTIPTPVPGALYVDPKVELGSISPLVYGTNHGPWVAVPFGMMPAAEQSGVTIVRFPGGAWGDNNNLKPYQIDQFITFCNQIGAIPSISVRLKNGTPEALRWLKQHETPLFQGHADRVAQTIISLADQKSTKDDLLKQAGYFANHKHRMQYLEMHSEGWLIGSGMVESGGKRFKDRFTRAGMRWSRAGAEHLLPIRTASMSGRFDARWQLAYNSPPN